MSLRYAIIPCSWKIHKIISIFKSGNWNSVIVLRISLPSNVSKVIEHLIYNKVVTKITDTISNSQFGFLQIAPPCSNLYIIQMNFSPNWCCLLWYMQRIWFSTSQPTSCEILVLWNYWQALVLIPIIFVQPLSSTITPQICYLESLRGSPPLFLIYILMTFST